MLRDREKEKSVLASHGRWIKELQESSKVIKQDLSLLRKRVSALETEISETAKTHRDLKAKINSVYSKITRLSANQESRESG